MSIRLNQTKSKAGGGDIYRTMCLQNRFLFILTTTLLMVGGALFAALLLKPTPVLLVDAEGRYLGRIEYPSDIPLNEANLEAISKRFIQHYLSQNSATLYEDAEIALNAMCPQMRRQKQEEWIQGGRLAEIVQRVQISRIIFSEFAVLKYLNPQDIQVMIAGKVLVNDGLNSGSDIQVNAQSFRVQLALRQVGVSEHNYLGVEICSVLFV